MFIYRYFIYNLVITMNIFVLIKPVPVVEEISILENGKDIDRSELKFFIGESDAYALEEGILKKEKYGGSVDVVTIAGRDIENFVDDMVYESYAKGADSGHVILYDEYMDDYLKAQLIASFLKDKKFDMILLGVQSNDTSYSLLGPILGETMSIPYITMVTKLDVENSRAIVLREMEDGYTETVEVPLPAIFTIQTGINTPRYPPFVKIRNARKMPINKIDGETLTAKPETYLKIKREKIFIPEAKKGGEIVRDEPEIAVKKIVETIKSAGVV